MIFWSSVSFTGLSHGYLREIGDTAERSCLPLTAAIVATGFLPSRKMFSWKNAFYGGLVNHRKKRERLFFLLNSSWSMYFTTSIIWRETFGNCRLHLFFWSSLFLYCWTIWMLFCVSRKSQIFFGDSVDVHKSVCSWVSMHHHFSALEICVL